MRLAVFVAVCVIFSVKEWCNLENWVRVRSRSLAVAPFDRSHKSSYSPSIVTMALSCIVCEIKSDLLAENREIFISHLYLSPPEGVTPSEFREFRLMWPWLASEPNFQMMTPLGDDRPLRWRTGILCSTNAWVQNIMTVHIVLNGTVLLNSCVVLLRTRSDGREFWRRRGRQVVWHCWEVSQEAQEGSDVDRSCDTVEKSAKKRKKDPT